MPLPVAAGDVLPHAADDAILFNEQGGRVPHLLTATSSSQFVSMHHQALLGDPFPAKSTVETAVADNAVVVFARRGCCLCYVVKLLLNCHGVNPALFDVDDKNEGDVESELTRIVGERAVAASLLPVLFVGGELFGGLEDLVRAHISGELVSRLRKARALWL